MALRALMLNKQIRERKEMLESLRAKDFSTREAELEQSIEEAESEEEKAAVEEAVEGFETEKAETDAEVRKLESEIAQLEEELRSIEVKVDKVDQKAERKEEKTMIKRWKDMGVEERDAFCQRDDVQKFLGEVRTAIREKRSISNAGYLIPQVLIGVLKESIEDYSKLYSRVALRQVPGTGRMVIEGTIPEAVWTEACANLNELDLSFSKVEVDGYKVGGYFKVCNATLEDSDIDLASELISALGQAIGLALDKAIVYGTGTKMPVGIVTALAAVSETPNIISHADTVKDVALAKALILDTAKLTSKYSKGDKIWIMNESTKVTLMANFVNTNAAGAIVTAMGNQMPVVGGEIITLGFMPNNTIVCGYPDLYLLAERAGTTIGTSEHAFWTADQTGFKGTARYDGKVLDANGFVAIGLNGVTPAANQVTFASDSANL